MTKEGEAEKRPEARPKDAPAEPSVMPGRWVRRGAMALVLLVVVFLAWKMSAAFFPRWWAQRVADQVQGDFTQGISWGLFYGFVFTAIPLLVFFQVRRRFLSWMWRGVVALVAVVLALPNWLTLAVVLGSSKAAHAGERIFDTDAPGFRNGTLAGAIVGVLVAVALSGSSIWLKHRKNQVRKLRGELDDRKKADAQNPDPDA